ncbi:MAG TPA: DegT/DnrJ/EryC1/StrS family aminotransferase [Acetobacteraceae bacterium]|nr:DegT/DnrJ/EryC1/StrS family aminotransferase [Acetobacteraceae bacterium]
MRVDLSNAKTAEIAGVPGRGIQILVPRLPSTDELIPYLRRIDASHWYSNYGPLWQEFRHKLTTVIARRTHQPGLMIALTSSGTTAIELALRARAHAGRRYCLMPSYTFIASAHAVCNAGFEPFLLDIDGSSLTLTPEIVADALPKLPEPPAAVLVISAYGAPPDIPAWDKFERDYGIPVVFDAAAALMSLEMAARQPLCVSLHATKVFGIGEGGAVLSSDEDLIERITAMTGFGFTAASRTSALRGGNYRLSEYAASVGLAALDSIDTKINALKKVVRTYATQLRNSPVLMQADVGERWVTMTLNVVLPSETAATTLHTLDQGGIPWRHWWGLGCHTHPAFANLRALDLSMTRNMAPRVVGVPCHTELSDDAVQTVCEHLLMRG